MTWRPWRLRPRRRRFTATILTPNQHLTSGGVYAIHQFAQHCARFIDVNLVVKTGAPEPLPAVRTYGSAMLDGGELPPADALLVPADEQDTGQILAAGDRAGVPIAMFQGYGVPGNPNVLANLDRMRRAVASAEWLAGEARSRGCQVELVRYGLDRRVFFGGCPTEERSPSIVMPTSHVEWKGTADGLEALHLARQELPQLGACFFGDRDPELPDVSFLPMATREAVAAAMREAMILVSPSWQEGFGLPGVEAMLCGAAVVSTDSMGSRDYAWPERTALVSPPRTPEALAENIVRLVRDIELRRRCVEQAGGLVERRFPDWSAAGEAFAAALRRLAA